MGVLEELAKAVKPLRYRMVRNGQVNIEACDADSCAYFSVQTSGIPAGGKVIVQATMNGGDWIELAHITEDGLWNLNQLAADGKGDTMLNEGRLMATRLRAAVENAGKANCWLVGK